MAQREKGQQGQQHTKSQQQPQKVQGAPDGGDLSERFNNLSVKDEKNAGVVEILDFRNWIFQAPPLESLMADIKANDELYTYIKEKVQWGKQQQRIRPDDGWRAWGDVYYNIRDVLNRHGSLGAQVVGRICAGLEHEQLSSCIQKFAPGMASGQLVIVDEQSQDSRSTVRRLHNAVSHVQHFLMDRVTRLPLVPQDVQQAGALFLNAANMPPLPLAPFRILVRGRAVVRCFATEYINDIDGQPIHTFGAGKGNIQAGDPSEVALALYFPQPGARTTVQFRLLSKMCEVNGFTGVRYINYRAQERRFVICGKTAEVEAAAACIDHNLQEALGGKRWLTSWLSDDCKIVPVTAEPPPVQIDHFALILCGMEHERETDVDAKEITDEEIKRRVARALLKSIRSSVKKVPGAKMIVIDKIPADEVIAVMAKMNFERQMQTATCVISDDTDFLQLQRYNVMKVNISSVPSENQYNMGYPGQDIYDRHLLKEALLGKAREGKCRSVYGWIPAGLEYTDAAGTVVVGTKEAPPDYTTCFAAIDLGLRRSVPWEGGLDRVLQWLMAQPAGELLIQNFARNAVEHNIDPYHMLFSSRTMEEIGGVEAAVRHEMGW